MSIVVVGGDHLGNIPHKLRQCGFANIQHYQGRKVFKLRDKISFSTDLVLVLTDYVGTDLAKLVKARAKKSNIKVNACIKILHLLLKTKGYCHMPQNQVEHFLQRPLI